MNCEVKNYIKRIIAVIDATFAFAKRKPEKKSGLYDMICCKRKTTPYL